MKRSEMVDLIFNTIMECYMQDMSTMEIAEVVLKKEEEAGILSPRSSEYEDHLDKYPKGYEWDPEDE